MRSHSAGEAWLEEGQRCAALLERSHLPFRLPEDWLEFVVTMALFVALLFGLYVGLISSWQLLTLRQRVFSGEVIYGLISGFLM